MNSHFNYFDNFDAFIKQVYKDKLKDVNIVGYDKKITNYKLRASLFDTHAELKIFETHHVNNTAISMSPKIIVAEEEIVLYPRGCWLTHNEMWFSIDYDNELENLARYMPGHISAFKHNINTYIKLDVKLPL